MAEAPDNTEPRCPACGGRLGGFAPDDTVTGIRCTVCDWVGAVTTNHNRPTFDHTPYDVWVEWAGHDRGRIIAAVGNALCIGVKAARELLDAGSPVARGVQALEVRRLSEMFRGLGLCIRVSPEYRWPLG
ncbi:hypothetical protein GobsT_44440 [Gemmata obscuriglobus]|uniref:Uncharacterized protein n=1 Tax=Gemmata obscuriglobus TaxID=114 RepID=A0A2Z3GT50_9BACT|nr:hypothetical protein [Gemmata obscuriglobus]AWM37569.1 hypothetical protein C1280_11485 [Gemmata obscuriglobus]QEG29646.1 hypothetical protein GobsT_44440 [Gemmata obscuriglobus]VTS08963.1 Uncharacterized protein OS=Achromobacter piechaudii HLE GN=QWC_10951 PE=4 SV=1 [Gemmata obscuriglobus UQM 2246]